MKILMISFIMVFMTISINSEYTVSQYQKNNPYNVQSKSIEVPEISKSNIIIDGIFSPGEWDGAAKISVPDTTEIYFMVNSGNLYIGLKYLKAFRYLLCDIYISKYENQFYNLHASARKQQGIHKFSDKLLRPTSSPISENNVWTVSENNNSGKVEGREFKINLKMLPSSNIKIALQFNVMDETFKSIEANRYPAKYNFESSNDWIELILPGNK